jgi:hypothetical protein
MTNPAAAYRLPFLGFKKTPNQHIHLEDDNYNVGRNVG